MNGGPRVGAKRWGVFAMLCAGLMQATAQEALGIQGARIRRVPEPQPALVQVAAGEQPIRLAHAGIDVFVEGSLAHTVIDLTLANPNARMLEGELQFPLHAGQTVTGFALDMADGSMRAAVPVPKARGRAGVRGGRAPRRRPRVAGADRRRELPAARLSAAAGRLASCAHHAHRMARAARAATLDAGPAAGLCRHGGRRARRPRSPACDCRRQRARRRRPRGRVARGAGRRQRHRVPSQRFQVLRRSAPCARRELARAARRHAAARTRRRPGLLPRGVAGARPTGAARPARRPDADLGRLRLRLRNAITSANCACWPPSSRGSRTSRCACASCATPPSPTACSPSAMAIGKPCATRYPCRLRRREQCLAVDGPREPPAAASLALLFSDGLGNWGAPASAAAGNVPRTRCRPWQRLGRLPAPMGRVARRPPAGPGAQASRPRCCS